MDGPAPDRPLQPLPAWLSQQIGDACRAFGDGWSRGARPSLEAFLGTRSEPARTVLLNGLLRIEVQRRRDLGETPQRSEYLARFPDHSRVIDAILGPAPAPAPPVLPEPAAAPPSPTAPPAEPVAADPLAREPVAAESVVAESSEEDTVDSESGEESNVAEADQSIEEALEIVSRDEPLAEPGRRSASEIPHQIGRFVIQKELGRGGFGTVYRAHDPQLDREVAIKVPRAGLLRTEKRLGRFLREARSAATVMHPNICPVYEIGEADGQHFLVMAYIDGAPLSKILARGQRIGARAIASTLCKLARALAEAHHKGVIHRDLKPANIMIDRRHEPIIMDFGLARRVRASESDLTQSGIVMGSPMYMSPEQARGEVRTVGPAADIYGLGVILYELLCLKRPFEGSVAEVLGQILYAPLPPPSQQAADVDPTLEAICLRALARDPAARWTSMTELAARLSDYLSGRPYAGSSSA